MDLIQKALLALLVALCLKAASQSMDYVQQALLSMLVVMLLRILLREPRKKQQQQATRPPPLQAASYGGQHDPLTLVEVFLSARDRGDAEACAAMCTDDMAWADPSKTINGLADVREQIFSEASPNTTDGHTPLRLVEDSGSRVRVTRTFNTKWRFMTLTLNQDFTLERSGGSSEGGGGGLKLSSCVMSLASPLPGWAAALHGSSTAAPGEQPPEAASLTTTPAAAAAETPPQLQQQPSGPLHRRLPSCEDELLRQASAEYEKLSTRHSASQQQPAQASPPPVRARASGEAGADRSGGGTKGGGGNGDGLTADEQWWVLSPATPSEQDVIAAAVTDFEIEATSEQRYLRLLRQLRALGPTATPAQLASRMREVGEWKREHLGGAPPTLTGDLAAYWPAAADLEHAVWALGYISLGLRCGRARGGHPVKIERVGLAQTERMERETGADGEERLARFYFGMIESMQVALDDESVAAGRLLGTYEIFDVSEMRISQVSFTTIRFAQRMMRAFSRIYAESTVKVAIINLPWLLRLPMATVLEVLPQRVRARVCILGDDYEEVLARDVDAEAMRLLRAGHDELSRHRGRRASFA